MVGLPCRAENLSGKTPKLDYELVGFTHRPDMEPIHEDDFTYLDQIIEFRRLQRTEKRVSARAQAMWYLLMDEYNRARWHCPLLLSSFSIMGELDLSKFQFIKTRAELVEHGYIQHVQNAGRQHAHYYVKILKWAKSVESKMGEFSSHGHPMNTHFVTDKL